MGSRIIIGLLLFISCLLSLFSTTYDMLGDLIELSEGASLLDSSELSIWTTRPATTSSGA